MTTTLSVKPSPPLASAGAAPASHAVMDAIGVGCLLDFDSFSRLHPQAHLVAASVPARFNSTDLRALGNGCRKLLQILPVHADFAIGVVRNSGKPEFRCLFAESSDAAKFGACLGARHVSKHAFASQRRFALDETFLEGLRTATGRAGRRKGSPQDWLPVLGVRRGR